MEDSAEVQNHTNETKWSTNPFINTQLRNLEKNIRSSLPTAEYYDPEKSQSIRGEPDIFSQSVLSLKEIIGSFSFDALDDSSKKAVIERLNYLEQQMLAKLFVYQPRQRREDKYHQKRFNAEAWLKYYEEKRQLARELLAPGRFFGHGTYIADLASIAREGMLAPIHLSRITGHGLAQVGRFNDSHPDTSYVFFTPVNPEKPGLIPAGVYSGGIIHGSKNWRKSTDLAVYYPSEVFIGLGSTIRFDGAEVALSSSELSKVHNGWLVGDEADPIRRLSLKYGYIICPSEELNQVTATLKDSGYNDDWIAEHVWSVGGVEGDLSIVEGGMYQRVGRNAKLINEWLQGRKRAVDQKKVLIEIQDHKARSSHLYFTARYQSGKGGLGKPGVDY